MAKFTKKITNLVNQQVPEFVLSDHPKFLEFVKTYYRFMESAEITLENIELTDGIQLETETAQTNSLVLDASKLDTDRTSLDAGDKLQVAVYQGSGGNEDIGTASNLGSGTTANSNYWTMFLLG